MDLPSWLISLVTALVAGGVSGTFAARITVRRHQAGRDNWESGPTSGPHSPTTGATTGAYSPSSGGSFTVRASGEGSSAAGRDVNAGAQTRRPRRPTRSSG